MEVFVDAAAVGEVGEQVEGGGGANVGRKAAAEADGAAGNDAASGCFGRNTEESEEKGKKRGGKEWEKRRKNEEK